MQSQSFSGFSIHIHTCTHTGSYRWESDDDRYTPMPALNVKCVQIHTHLQARLLQHFQERFHYIHTRTPQSPYIHKHTPRPVGIHWQPSKHNFHFGAKVYIQSLLINHFMFVINYNINQLYKNIITCITVVLVIKIKYQKYDLYIQFTLCQMTFHYFSFTNVTWPFPTQSTLKLIMVKIIRTNVIDIICIIAT